MLFIPPNPRDSLPFPSIVLNGFVVCAWSWGVLKIAMFPGFRTPKRKRKFKLEIKITLSLSNVLTVGSQNVRSRNNLLSCLRWIPHIEQVSLHSFQHVGRWSVTIWKKKSIICFRTSFYQNFLYLLEIGGPEKVHQKCTCGGNPAAPKAPPLAPETVAPESLPPRPPPKLTISPRPFPRSQWRAKYSVNQKKSNID